MTTRGTPKYDYSSPEGKKIVGEVFGWVEAAPIEREGIRCRVGRFAIVPEDGSIPQSILGEGDHSTWGACDRIFTDEQWCINKQQSCVIRHSGTCIITDNPDLGLKEYGGTIFGHSRKRESQDHIPGHNLDWRGSGLVSRSSERAYEEENRATEDSVTFRSSRYEKQTAAFRSTCISMF
jgi:hypothetical protein